MADIICCTGIFCGLVEDSIRYVTKSAPDCVVYCSLLALLFSEFGYPVYSFPAVDAILMFTLFAILFTIFATVGVVNAFNLIDGLNGLSSYVAISVAVSL